MARSVVSVSKLLNAFLRGGFPGVRLAPWNINALTPWLKSQESSQQPAEGRDSEYAAPWACQQITNCSLPLQRQASGNLTTVRKYVCFFPLHSFCILPSLGVFFSFHWSRRAREAVGGINAKMCPTPVLLGLDSQSDIHTVVAASPCTHEGLGFV